MTDSRGSWAPNVPFCLADRLFATPLFATTLLSHTRNIQDDEDCFRPPLPVRHGVGLRSVAVRWVSRDDGAALGSRELTCRSYPPTSRPAESAADAAASPAGPTGQGSGRQCRPGSCTVWIHLVWNTSNLVGFSPRALMSNFCYVTMSRHGSQCCQDRPLGRLAAPGDEDHLHRCRWIHAGCPQLFGRPRHRGYQRVVRC